MDMSYRKRQRALLLRSWLRALTLVVPLAVSLAFAQQPRGHVALSLGSDLGCGGLGGELILKQQPWSYSAEVFACEGAHRFALRLGYQPIPFIPLEAEGYVGLLGKLPTLGLLLSSRIPFWGGDPPLGQLNLALRLGFGITHTPLIGLLPGLRLVLALEYWQVNPFPSFGKPMETLGQTSPEGTFLGSSCVQPSAETLAETFWNLVESTRSAVISSLSAIYMDFQVEISNLEIMTDGANGTIRGRYSVGATQRTTGRRYTYAGQGVAYFHHDGCSWQLVSYKY